MLREIYTEFIKRIFFRSIQSGGSMRCAWKLEPGLSSQTDVCEFNTIN